MLRPGTGFSVPMLRQWAGFPVPVGSGTGFPVPLDSGTGLPVPAADSGTGFPVPAANSGTGFPVSTIVPVNRTGRPMPAVIPGPSVIVYRTGRPVVTLLVIRLYTRGPLWSPFLGTGRLEVAFLRLLWWWLGTG